MEVLTLDFDSACDAAAPAHQQADDPPPLRRRGGPRKGPASPKARERLAAVGIEVDDPDRPRNERKRKLPSGAAGDGLTRDGPNLPLRNPGYEEAARHVAGGMPERDAWRLAGYSPNNYTYVQVVSAPAFVERVAELREQYQRASGISVPYLQERLLRLTTADIGDYVEKVPYSSRWHMKDLLSLPPEVRACVSEVTFDKNGQVNFKLHDKTKAIETLLRTLGATGEGTKVNVTQIARIERVIVAPSAGSAQSASALPTPSVQVATAPPRDARTIVQALIKPQAGGSRP